MKQNFIRTVVVLTDLLIINGLLNAADACEFGSCMHTYNTCSWYFNLGSFFYMYIWAVEYFEFGLHLENQYIYEA